MPALGKCWALFLLAAGGCAAQAPTPELLVAEQSARRVLEPARFAWASSERSSATLPSAVALGGAASGRVLLYFEFPELNEPRRLRRAELLLATDGTPGDSVAVELSGSDPAKERLESWADQPRAVYPRLAKELAAGGSPARLDVTEIVQARSKPDEPLRVLLRAEPGSGAPVLVHTGAASGLGPRLEAYWE